MSALIDPKLLAKLRAIRRAAAGDGSANHDTTPSPPKPAPQPDLIDAVGQLEWVRKIAEYARNKFHLYAEAAEDVYGAGLICMIANRAKYTPQATTTDHEGAFRGWCYRDVLTACQSECERLLNGGTYNRRRRKKDGSQQLICVDHLSTHTTDDGSAIELESTRDMDDRPLWKRLSV